MKNYAKKERNKQVNNAHLGEVDNSGGSRLAETDPELSSAQTSLVVDKVSQGA